MYEVTGHTADVGLRITANSFEALCVDAAQGLFSLLVDGLTTVEPRQELSFEISGDDPEYLLFDWLNELLYTFDTKRILLCAFDVCVRKGDGIHATARGEAFDSTRHRLAHEIKAITYHGLSVGRTDDGWEARVILDV